MKSHEDPRLLRPRGQSGESRLYSGSGWARRAAGTVEGCVRSMSRVCPQHGRRRGSAAGKPAGSVDKSGRRVRSMFASIAGRYDLLNHLLSLNIDRSWRTFTTRTVPPRPASRSSTAAPGRPTWPSPTTRPAAAGRRSWASDFCHEMLVIGNEPRSARRRPRDRRHADRGRHPAAPAAGRHLRRRDRRVRPPERGRHGQGDRRDGPGRPARRQGGDPRVFPAPRADPRPALPDVLPARPAQGRPDDRAQLLRRLQLPAGQRPPVPRRPGDARPPRLSRPDRPPPASAHVRDRHALCRHQAGRSPVRPG